MTGCAVRHSGLDVIKWCDFIKSGCDVVCGAYGVIQIHAVMTYIHFFS